MISAVSRSSRLRKIVAAVPGRPVLRVTVTD
jgi:hypothetical protein